MKIRQRLALPLLLLGVWLAVGSGRAGAQTQLRVTDGEGTPLIGAAVFRLPAEGLGVTDPNGEIRLPVLAARDTIRISYLGFRSTELTAGQLTTDYFEIALLPGPNVLGTATVVGRRDELARDLPYQITTLDRGARTQVQSLSTADALAELGGVHVQKSQLGGGSPVVRGFEANRVLLVVDGVRMNNAIFRNGHLQNAITVDPNALERIELIHGAGALAYGSDAIGGVVHFRTLRPEFRRAGSGTSGYQEINLSSAARAVNYAGRLSYGGRQWAGLTHYGLTRFGDLRAGDRRPAAHAGFGRRAAYVVGGSGPGRVVTNDRPNVQVGSGYTQYNLLQKFRFALGDRLELDVNLQFSTSSDVPRYDALNERRNGQLRWARWDYGPQTRALAALRLTDRRPTPLYDVASYLLSYQFVAEDRIQRRLGDPGEEHSLVDVGALNFQADLARELGAKTQLRYGLDLRDDRVVARAFLRDRSTGATTTEGQATRYPSRGSGLRAAGLYADLSYRLSARWQLRGGLRYGRQQLTATFGADDPIAWPAFYLDGIRNQTAAVTAAVGGRYRYAGHDLRLLFAQGFRAPNVDDFAKFRENNGRIQVPNPRLRPERSNTLEASYGRTAGGFRAQITVYATRLTDAVIRRDGFLPDGRTFFVSRGDTLLVQTNVNAERAVVYGGDLEGAFRTGTGWDFFTSLHWLRGRRRQLAPDGRQLSLPQDHIPPAYGRGGLRFARDGWEGQLRVDFQLAKRVSDYAVNTITGTAATGYAFDREGTADNLELTPFLAGENRYAGSYGWWTLNAYAGYHFSEKFSLRLKAENLLDRHYRTFASGISAAGLDVGIGGLLRW